MYHFSKSRLTINVDCISLRNTRTYLDKSFDSVCPKGPKQVQCTVVLGFRSLPAFRGKSILSAGSICTPMFFLGVHRRLMEQLLCWPCNSYSEYGTCIQLCTLVELVNSCLAVLVVVRLHVCIDLVAQIRASLHYAGFLFVRTLFARLSITLSVFIDSFVLSPVPQFHYFSYPIEEVHKHF